MRKLLTFFALVALASILHAQDTAAIKKDTTWKRGGYASLTFNQVAFEHWSAGGENSVSLTGIGLAFANYHKDKNFWNNYANLQYGFVSTQFNHSARKNTDVLEVQTKAGHDLGKKFYLTGLINFRSQFAPGYNYPNDSLVVSQFLAPGYLTLSLGIEWKPVTYFSIYLSPVTGKFTFVTNQAIADQVLGGASLYGTQPAVYDSDGVLLTHGKTFRSELGAYMTIQFVKDVIKNVSVVTRLQLFDNYSDQNASNRTNVDVNYDLLINMKVNKFLTASIFGNLIYDNDIIIADLDSDGLPTGTQGPRTQLKEGIGIGLSYKFGDEFK